MKKNETKLLLSRAVNKIGNVMYDYGNSTWIASMGAAGSILGAVMADKLFKNSYNSILIALALCGTGLIMITMFAVIFMPLSTAIMTAVPFSVDKSMFAVIGCGILVISGYGFYYSKRKL